MTSQAPVTILNVDDNEVARYTKTRLLKHAGFEVLEAATGQGAIDSVERLGPALVLLDVQLPDILGTTVCRVVKERWPATMVLQTSATFVSAGDRTRGLDGGADGYLIQPVDPDELVAAIRALLRLHAAEEATRALNDSLEERIRVRTAELREANVQLVQQMAQRERAEEALIHAQKLEAVGQLTGAIAHDFNNLLAGLMGYMQLIDRMARDDTTRNMAKKALALVTRGSKLTGRLLSMAHARVAKVEAVDVRTVVEGMREWLAQTLGPAFTVTIAASADDLVALTDASQLEFAILNLAVNARDAMPRGGSVRLALERRTAGAGSEAPPGLTDGDFVVVSLADDGHGMDPQVASQAFNPFYSTKGPGQGTGLGLAQVYSLAEQSSGAARIISAPDEGTVVEIWLKAGRVPAGLAVPGEPPAPAAQAPLPGEQVQLVLVDDEPDVLLTVCALLTSSGYRVTPFGSGGEALAHLRENLQRNPRARSADVLISDLALPGMSGLELARHAREIDPALPLVFITGHAEADDLEITANGGTLLRKPFSPTALTSAVTAALLGPRRAG